MMNVLISILVSLVPFFVSFLLTKKNEKLLFYERVASKIRLIFIDKSLESDKDKISKVKIVLFENSTLLDGEIREYTEQLFSTNEMIWCKKIFDICNEIHFQQISKPKLSFEQLIWLMVLSVAYSISILCGLLIMNGSQPVFLLIAFICSLLVEFYASRKLYE